MYKKKYARAFPGKLNPEHKRDSNDVRNTD